MADLSPEQFEQLLQKNRDKAESYADNSASNLLDSAFLGPGAVTSSAGNDYARRNDIKLSPESDETTAASPVSATLSPMANPAYNNSELDAILNPMHQLNKLPNVVKPEDQEDDSDDDSSDNATSKSSAPAVASKSKPAPPTLTSPLFPSKPITDDEMQDALEQRKHNMGMLGMLQGASTIGSAFAQQKPDENYTKGLQDLAKMPVEDIRQGRAALKEKMELDEEKAKNDPNSQNSIMAREGMRKMLNKIGYSGLANKITDNMSAKQIQDGLGGINVNNLLTQHENQQNRLEMAKMRYAQMGLAKQQQLDAKDQQRLETAGKLMTATKDRNTTFGKMANTYRQGEALETLIGNIDPNDINPQQVYELAAGVDTMISTSGSTVSGREHLIPQSISGDAAKLKQYVFNMPTGAQQGEFVRKLIETARREKELAAQQIKRESTKMLSPYADLAKKHPEAWQRVLYEHDLPLDLFSQPIGQQSKQQTSNVKSTGKPKTVVQNGHTYTLNEQTGEYE